MYLLNKFCCICMNTSDLKHLFTVDNEGVSHYNKLTSSIAEMDFKEMNNQSRICGECCATLNTVYNFRQMCLRSKTNLINYISQLQSISHASGTLSVRLKDVIHEIMAVEEDIEIKCENEDSNHSFVENNAHSGCETESYKESIQFPASVKEECESEEDAAPAHEDTTADHVNEGIHIDVDDETNMVDEDYTELYSEIDIEEHPLVKEEPMSATEAPQDGSTGQATSEQPEECEICKESFICKSQFTRHMIIHSDETLYKCEICKKGFNSVANLSLHMPVHFSGRPYGCEICKKMFSYKQSLTRHMLVHTGERPYQCEICEKTFRQTSTLKVHMQLHSRQNFKCKICSKSFNQKFGLATHMEVHSDVRPYGCEICTIRFIHMEEFTKHMKTHTHKNPYKCEICKKMFSQNSNLNKHMLLHSKIYM